MKKIYLTIGIIFASSTIFAEKIDDILRDRAELGDADAQALLGLMYQHGCIVSKNHITSESWYKKAADQDDSFAESQLRKVKRTKDKKEKSSPEARKKLAMTAEYEGRVTVEELTRDRDTYVGKVVALVFYGANYSSSSSRCSFSVYGKNYDFYVYMTLPEEQDAIDWAMDCDKRDSSRGEVFVFVEKNKMLALGTKKRKKDDNYTYKW